MPLVRGECVCVCVCVCKTEVHHVFLCAASNGHVDSVQVMLRYITNSSHVDCVDVYGR